MGNRKALDFKSLPQLLDYFKEESTCIEYYENLRWNGNPVCPHCEAERPYRTNRGYKCSNKECHKKFTVKVGTIFESSNISFRLWFAAIYLMTSHKKGISSVQLGIDLGITQKSAWFMLHRIREMLRDKAPEKLGANDIVEIDEAYLGGKEKNKHYSKRRSEDKITKNDGTPYIKKKTIVGIIERGGKVALKHMPNHTQEKIDQFIDDIVQKGSSISTDESKLYARLNLRYTHDTVRHGIESYVSGSTHTNTIENFWSTLKRGICGIYHHVSDKHLGRYLDEYTARFNSREDTSCEKFEKFLSKSKGTLSHFKLVRCEYC